MYFLLFLFFLSAKRATSDFTLNETAANFLKRFGYINQLPTSMNVVSDLKAGITKYQTFYHLPSTGRLDDATVAHIHLPRCGNRDFIESSNKQDTSFTYLGDHIVPKLTKRNLSWKISQYPILIDGLSEANIDDAARKAMQMWSNKCNVNFYQTTSFDFDIELKFQRSFSHDSDCDSPFNDGILGHYVGGSSNPHKTHYNDDKYWRLTDDGDHSKVYLVTLIAHEIGHVLGFGHTDVRDSIMFSPHDDRAPVTELSSDDIAACSEKYGRRQSLNCPSEVTRYAETSTRTFPICAIFHEKNNCEGYRLSVAIGKITDLGEEKMKVGWNWLNEISSLEINPGCKVTYCTGTSFSGSCTTSEGGTKGRNVNSLDFPYDDNIKSESCTCGKESDVDLDDGTNPYRKLKRGILPPAKIPTSEMNTCGVLVEHFSPHGVFSWLSDEANNLELPSHWINPAAYTYAIAGPGCTLFVCSQNDFKGECVEVEGGHYKTSDFLVVSSFKCSCNFLEKYFAKYFAKDPFWKKLNEIK